MSRGNFPAAADSTSPMNQHLGCTSLGPLYRNDDNQEQDSSLRRRFPVGLQYSPCHVAVVLVTGNLAIHQGFDGQNAAQTSQAPQKKPGLEVSLLPSIGFWQELEHCKDGWQEAYW
jgi:hypothetical protein